MSDPVCPICLDDAVPTDFSVGCCEATKNVHSWCVVRSMRTTKGHDENNKGRGRQCMVGCGSPWSFETFRTAKAMVQRAQRLAELEDQKDPARHVPACPAKPAGDPKAKTKGAIKKLPAKLKKDKMKMLQQPQQTTTTQYMCDGSCQKAQRGTYLGTNDASNFKRHLVAHHGAEPYQRKKADKVRLVRYQQVTLKLQGNKDGDGVVVAPDFYQVAAAPAGSDLQSDCLGLGQLYGSDSD